MLVTERISSFRFLSNACCFNSISRKERVSELNRSTASIVLADWVAADMSNIMPLKSICSFESFNGYLIKLKTWASRFLRWGINFFGWIRFSRSTSTVSSSRSFSTSSWSSSSSFVFCRFLACFAFFFRGAAFFGFLLALSARRI